MREARYLRERAEIRLERGHVLWLGIAFFTAMGLCFGFGVFVGRRAERLHHEVQHADPIETIEEDQKMHVFYERLTGPSSGPTPVETSERATTLRPPSGAPPTPQEKAAPAQSVAEGLRAGPAPVGAYTVQVSAFPSEAEAKAYAAALERRGFYPFVVSARLGDKGTWYRVRIGSFATAQEAALGKALLARSDIPGWVLQVTPL